MKNVVLASILRPMYAISQQKQTPPLSLVFLPTVSIHSRILKENGYDMLRM